MIRSTAATLLCVSSLAAIGSPPPATPDAIVRSQRADYNAAVAAHDAKRLRSFLVDDYHLISGSTGSLDSGADMAAQSYADEEFKDPTFVTYRRDPLAVRVAASGKRIAETGRFVGIWHKPDGTMRKRGIYLAMWVPDAGTWRLKSESFVTLGCTGSGACGAVD